MFIPVLEVLDPLVSIGSNTLCLLLAAYAFALTGAPPAGGAA